jgi:SNF2 family DNA or RNA helicase
MNSKTNNQQSAFDKLSKLKVGALFMEQGTGKTKVALDLIASKIHKVDYVLWICPYSLKNEIETERQKWHSELTLDIVGCESIGSSDRIYLDVLEKMQNKRCFVVVDESLKIKNKDAKRTERILKIGELATYKLILNGTPLSKNVLDLWTQMQFLSPKILNMSYNEFKNTYCEYYIRGKLKGIVKKQHNIEHLISLIQPYIFDCKLDIEAKKRYHDIYYLMNCKEYAEYEFIKNEYLEKVIDDMSNIDFFAFSQLLQSHYCSVTDRENKLNKLINDIEGKVIVFVKYLKSIPDGALKVVGDMNTEQRKNAIQRFRENERVLYITYGCGAFGLNLQFCKNIIFAEHTFDYAQREQAEARIYRIGQEYDVDYYNLWCNVGLERLIQGSLDKKSNLLDEVKKEIAQKGVKEWVKSI